MASPFSEEQLAWLADNASNLSGPPETAVSTGRPPRSLSLLIQQLQASVGEEGNNEIRIGSRWEGDRDV